MDPLSVTASIIAIVQLSSEVVRYISTAKGARTERQRLRNEIQACDDIIQQVYDGASTAEEDKTWADVVKTLERPDGPLDQFRATLVLIEKRLKPQIGHKKTLNALMWPFQEKEVKELVALLNRQQSLLQLVMTNENRKLGQAIYQESLLIKLQLNKLAIQIEESCSAIERRLDDINKDMKQFHSHQEEREIEQEWRELLEWLSPIDYSLQQSDLLRRRHTDTGKWLLNHDIYRAWERESKQILFCPGIPGAGKTILSSVIIDHLKSQHDSSQMVGIAYAFCNYRQQDEQTPLHLLANILKQLLYQQPSEEAKMLLFAWRSKKHQPSVDDITKILSVLLPLFTRVFVVIDALDEMIDGSAHLTKFLVEVLRLQQEQGINVLATSRDVPSVVEHFKHSPRLEVRASPDDIARYVRSEIANLPSFVTRSQPLCEDIIQKVTKGSQDMFLLAKIYIESLSRKPTVKAIKSSLEQFRQQNKNRGGSGGQSSLQIAYDSVMDRIKAQGTELNELAMMALYWVTYAKRPLTSRELVEALAIENGSLHLDKDNAPDVDFMITICMGLLTIDDESGIVRLMHYTTQQYLMAEKPRLHPNARSTIASACVTYISSEAFATGPCRSRAEYDKRIEEHPFYLYASQFWGKHATRKSSCDEVMKFLLQAKQVGATGQCLFFGHNFQAESSMQKVDIFKADLSNRDPTCYTLVAYFGLKHASRALLTSADTARSCGEGNQHNLGGSPLQYGHSNMDAIDHMGHTPLMHSIRRGHDEVVDLLLAAGAKVAIRDDGGYAHLLAAICAGRVAMVNRLLENGAKVDSTSFIGQTPLMLAIETGSVQICELLLRHGAQPNFRDHVGCTALFVAVFKRQHTILDLLVEHEAELDIADNKGFTALIWASVYNEREIVMKLVKHGSNVNARERLGRTALFYATLHGYYDIAHIFCASPSIDCNATDISGNSILSMAVRRGAIEIVETLLAKEHIDLTHVDKYGRSCVWWALAQGKTSLVQRLTKIIHDKGLTVPKCEVSVPSTSLPPLSPWPTARGKPYDPPVLRSEIGE